MFRLTEQARPSSYLETTGTVLIIIYHNYEPKGPLGCIMLHFFKHAMRLAQTILTVLISRYQNTFQKLKIRIQRGRRLFHFTRNNVN